MMPRSPPPSFVHAAQTEKATQRRIVALCEACGCKVYSTSQVRPAMVSEGIPDLLVFSPLRGFSFIEAKRVGGKQRPAQREFQAHCERAGQRYILADGVEVVAEWLGAKPEGRK
jgi:predicted type IV restriction endonuclease